MKRSLRSIGIVALLAGVGFAAIAVAVQLSRTLELDMTLARWIELVFGKASSTEMNTVYYISKVVPALGGLAGVVCLALSRRREALLWAVVVGGLLLADPVLKALFRRPAISRIPGDYSFPSGSAMLSMGVVVLGVLTLREGWRLIGGVVGAAAVVTFGAMIVEARWHYPSDVVGGWLVAIAWVAFTWLVVVARDPAQGSAEALAVL